MKDGQPCSRPLGLRARQRLRIAARLLGRVAIVEPALDRAWYAAVLARIGELPPRQRDRLRERVDWVEAYECAEPPLGSVGRVRR